MILTALTAVAFFLGGYVTGQIARHRERVLRDPLRPGEACVEEWGE